MTPKEHFRRAESWARIATEMYDQAVRIGTAAPRDAAAIGALYCDLAFVGPLLRDFAGGACDSETVELPEPDVYTGPIVEGMVLRSRESGAHVTVRSAHRGAVDGHGWKVDDARGLRGWVSEETLRADYTPDGGGSG